MYVNVTLLFVFGITVGVGASALVLLPLLKKKGVKVEEIAGKVDKAMNMADSVLQVADKIVPNNPVVKTLDVIETYAKKGAGCAEQLYLTSKLDGEARSDKAKDTVYNALEIAGITVTPEIDQLIKDTIESEVLLLGHKPVDVKEQQEAAKAIQAKNDALVQENAQLKQTINTVQSTVAATSVAQ
ncbi:hypothetical protein [Clostridium sp. JN-9]|uniref:hypothetical protein n=1 Tax=Clostridium sp. JN-9 TaxID=2507159 RepID=UPI000FFE2A43|nr:hypothetical protein [Clostridium sp. JN-9]QAT40815.1 hypothetical protein EQM05_11395 [Clostridium sp. JN-9]